MNAFCYTPEALKEVERLRERRRNAISNGERGLYDMLTVEERTFHGRAYQDWLDMKSSDPILRQTARERGESNAGRVVDTAEPFAQPPDTTKPTPYAPELPAMQPLTQAPWADARPVAPEPFKDGPFAAAPPLVPPTKPVAAATPVVRRKIKT